MKPYANIILSGIVYLLIPALQRALSLIRRLITVLMGHLDRLAFMLAEKSASDK